jgi:outer membrane immunogenic protein
MLFRVLSFAIIGMLFSTGSARADAYLKDSRAPCCSWNGFYIGVHGGYAWGTLIPPSQDTGHASEISLAGGFGGLQAGYNIQVAPNWFFGVEQDVWLGKISGGADQPFPAPTIDVETTLGGTVRGRFGYVMDHRARALPGL